MSLNGNIHIINPQVQCLAVNCSFYFLPIYNHLLLHHHTRSFSQSELIFSSHFTIFCFLSPLQMDRWMNGIKTRKYMHMKMWRLFFLSSNFSLIHNIFLLYFTFLSWNMWWDVVPYIVYLYPLFDPFILHKFIQILWMTIDVSFNNDKYIDRTPSVVWAQLLLL